MLSLLIGTIGSIVALVGWFDFKSLVILLIGTLGYIIETFLERDSLEKNAIILDIVIFVIGCIVGLFLKTPFYVCGLIATNIYSLIVGLFSIGIMFKK